MRVLFTTQPALSHLYPLAPLALALREAGHQVAFVSSRRFCSVVESSGFECFAAGLNWLVSEVDEILSSLRTAHQGREPRYSVLRDIFAGETAHQMTPGLLAIAEAWKPDLIVRDPVEFGGCVVAELLRIPHISGRENRFLSPRQLRDAVGDRLSQLRLAHGLSPDEETEMPYRYLGLAWVHPRYIAAVDGSAFYTPAQPFGSYFHQRMHFLRPALFDQSGDERLPPWVATLPDQPTVYATLGTVFNRRPEIFQAILDGLRDEPINLIITLGRNQDPADFGPQPPQVHIEQYIPQTQLFPFCDLVITAGGFGTVMAALDHGLPLVVIPVGADQPVNALRCIALGIGEQVPAADCSAEAIRVAVSKVLAEQEYARRAQQLQTELRSLPGADHGVALLERLVAEKAPINRADVQL